jgi:uncharacterized protein with HEPN domain
MTDYARKYLADILKAVNLAYDFSKDIEDEFVFYSDLKTQSAVERQLGIIGEAINQLRKFEPDILLSHANQIVGFRNRIIHAYDMVDERVVWTILKIYLPILEKEVQSLLEKD